MSLQQTVHATPLITKFGKDMQVENITLKTRIILEAKEMQAVLYRFGVIYRIVWATMQDTTQPGLNFHQEMEDNEQSNFDHIDNSDNGISECDS